jgi:E3 ubiquitin-protein ligase MARCH6
MDINIYLDICRVCRSEGLPDKPLYHPCICTGSIKYIHQEWYDFYLLIILILF